MHRQVGEAKVGKPRLTRAENIAGTAQSAWMAANAGQFGFVQPDWARQGGEKPEPWHWEFTG